MLILAEKPAVAKDFAKALNCSYKNGFYQNATTDITNCVGHLFKEELPSHYGTDYPIIPNHWDYRLPDDTKLIAQSKLVLKLLKQHKNDTIIIATDADREGEVIARECLLMAGITDISKIKRFWVSQALTKEVILDGLKNVKPLSEYKILAEQGFSRQHADWLVGMNFCRYISNAAGTKLTVGRVQTAILSAIDQRCEAIRKFVSKEYYQHSGIFEPSRGGSTCRGLYFIEIQDDSEKVEFSSFDNSDNEEKLKSCIGKNAKIIDSKVEKKITNPPQLYNLNALQKDAFKYFGYSASQTLKITQSLYEELKCVSYPRTPSKVMGSGNVDLCRQVADTLSKKYDYFKTFPSSMQISLSDKRCFNDSKLEAHHALIPLKELPDSATQEQQNIYYLIFDRFFEAFLPPCEWEKQTFILEVDSNKFKITGKKIIFAGFKSKEIQNILIRSKQEQNLILPSQSENTESDEQEEIQPLENINWNELKLIDVETKQKWTKPPAYFNEASILSFMENPKNLSADSKNLDRHVTVQKLVGLGTPATRHTFIPKLLEKGYITQEKKNFITTTLGVNLLKAVRSSAIKSLADISATTDWEECLDKNPNKFLEDTKDFVRNAISQEIKIEVVSKTTGIICPICKKEIRKGKSNWYCTGYKDGCKFTLWEKIAGAKLTEKDVKTLCNGEKTEIKHCTNKEGKAFDCKFKLNAESKIEFVFEKKN